MQLSSVLQSHRHEYGSVVPFDSGKDKLLLMDFTKANTEISESILDDINEFIVYINGKLNLAGARYGIGGYNEHRTVYGRSKVFDAAVGEDEPRRLHLGTDIWGKPHTAVMAPLDGIVHSFAFNDNFGDYGATIILSHQLGGISFYTLYGHLSLSSLKNIYEGDSVKKGEVFAEFGITAENGHWPPHLHFQIINDLQGWAGDYPGVCKFSEKEKWLSNCPDPDLVLRFSRYL